MPFTYEDLGLGAIRQMKVNIITEAVRDLYYLSHIRQDFVEQKGVTDNGEATRCTCKITADLIDHGYCYLATWGEQKGTYKEVIMNHKDLYEVIHNYRDTNSNPFDFFLLPKEKGHDWAARYEMLIDEL